MHAAEIRPMTASHALDLLTAADPVFVFGSNTLGRHGKGAALFAAQWRGAERGIGEGRTGQAYALPTKDDRLLTLAIDEIQGSISRFIQYARANPHTHFEVTRVGCGLAGYQDGNIAPMFTSAPNNCELPYIWQQRMTGTDPRIIVAGSRHFTDYPRLCRSLDKITSRLGKFAIVSGTARGADSLGERYAAERGIECLRVPAEWERYGRAAGMIRNQRMSWMASHLVAFWDGNSPGTGGMIRTAKADGLRVRAIRIDGRELSS